MAVVRLSGVYLLDFYCSVIQFYVLLRAYLAVVRPSGVYLLDFYCSVIQFYLLLRAYLSFLYLLLYLNFYVQEMKHG